MSLSRYPLHADALGPFKSVYLAFLEGIRVTFGVDPVLIIEGAIGLTAAATFFRYAAGYVSQYARRLFVASAHVGEEDQLYAHLMRWMTDNQPDPRSFQSVRVTTRYMQDDQIRRGHRMHPRYMLPAPEGDGWDDDGAEGAALDLDKDFDPAQLISYRSVVGRMPIQLQPFQSSHFFRHQGTWFLFSHNTKTETASHFFPEPRVRGSIRLECLGRSPKPIEDLLWDVQTYNLEHTKSMTTVYRALAVHGMHQWDQIVSRPSRDMSTVIFPKDKKYALLKDINEYLHPRTRRWYANHGIPYRRGYLCKSVNSISRFGLTAPVSGAPGTGKTSLTAAIAGIFGLNIYVLSLLDPALTESQLNSLMSGVPSRCILLLEDVDAAGLTKRSDAAGSSRKQPTPVAETFLAEFQPPGAGVPEIKPQNSGISLSALLNAIDGVASQEGRVLIMTTNAPNSLDEALVRPGRIDMHVHFDLPSRVEIEELFLSMYSDTIDRRSKSLPPPQHSENRVAPKSAAGEGETTKGQEKERPEASYIPAEQIQAMAIRFAAALPEAKLNLADIQGFMLGYKRDPLKACENIGAWASERVKSVEVGKA